jgi:hypothetical protein
VPTVQTIPAPAVNQAFPVNWIWWVTLIIANGLLSVVSEFAIYYLRDMREIQLEN